MLAKVVITLGVIALTMEATMNCFEIGIFGMGLALVTATAGAHAQDTIITEPPSGDELTIERTTPKASSWEEFEYKELQLRARRSRNALIGTTAATVVGVSLVFVFAARCDAYDPQSGTNTACYTRGQEAGLSVGAALTVGGTIGMLTSGIMLGVRNGKLRRLDDRIRLGRSALYWDPLRSRFAF